MEEVEKKMRELKKGKQNERKRGSILGSKVSKKRGELRCWFFFQKERETIEGEANRKKEGFVGYNSRALNASSLLVLFFLSWFILFFF